MTTDFEWRERVVETENGPATLLSLICRPLWEAGFINAFSTRRGGVSRLPDQDLNLAYTNDSRENVNENRGRFLKAVQAEEASIITAKQNHSNHRFIVENKPNKEEPAADALISREGKILLAVKTADCLPLLIGDKKTGIFAAIHAGWRGTLSRVTELTFQDLKKRFRVDPRTCLAALGPRACGACYEVGEEVAEPFRAKFDYADWILKRTKEKWFLDVKEANVQQLLSSGVLQKHIFSTDQCSIHNKDLFFSYRREGDETGRMLSVIGRK